MSSGTKKVFLTAFVLLLLAGVPAAAQARVAYTASKPALSATPVAGTPFTVSGVVRPKATATSHTVVKIRLYMLMDGHWGVMDTYRAALDKMPAGTPGTAYSREMTIPMDGRHAVRAFHYRGGKLVKKSTVTYFDVQLPTQTITIDPNSTADVNAPADTPIDVVFPGNLTGCAANIAFLSSEFTKTSSSPLTYHCDGVPAGRYAWKCSMMNCHYGDLVVGAPAQQITIDPNSTADVNAPADTPIDVVFPGNLTGCAANIAFLSSEFTKTSSSPLTYHCDGVPAGRYAWKCSMMNCHYGDLVVQSAGAATRLATAAERVTYTTSKPALSTAPHKGKPFTCSGSFSPKSTSKSRATIKIILWMKSGSGWGKMGTYSATVSGGTRYSRSITIPMKGDHGVQAVQYRNGKQVSSSATRYFTVKP